MQQRALYGVHDIHSQGLGPLDVSRMPCSSFLFRHMACHACLFRNVEGITPYVHTYMPPHVSVIITEYGMAQGPALINPLQRHSLILTPGLAPHHAAGVGGSFKGGGALGLGSWRQTSVIFRIALFQPHIAI